MVVEKMLAASRASFQSERRHFESRADDGDGNGNGNAGWLATTEDGCAPAPWSRSVVRSSVARSIRFDSFEVFF